MRACLVVASCFALACANYVARPIPPREASVGPDRVRIDHWKANRLAVGISGPHHVTAVGFEEAAPQANTGCVDPRRAATRLEAEAHGAAPARPDETLVEAVFPNDVFVAALTAPSGLAVALDSTPPTCLHLAMCSTDPGSRWAFPPYDHHWQVGRGTSLYGIVADEHRWGVGVAWDLLHVGRWLGPVRPTLGLGVLMGSDQLAVRLGALVLGYPLVIRHFGLGLAAGYDLTPAWSHHFQDGDHFKWTHGPRAEIHLAYLGPQLLGLPPPYMTASAALVLWGARADADRYSAVQFGLGVQLN